MPIIWHHLGQGHPNGLHQVERGMEWAQEPLPGFFWHPNNAGTSLTCNNRKTNAPWNATKTCLLYKTRHRKASFPAFPRGFSPLPNTQLKPRGYLQGCYRSHASVLSWPSHTPHHKELPSSNLCFMKSRKIMCIWLKPHIFFRSCCTDQHKADEKTKKIRLILLQLWAYG